MDESKPVNSSSCRSSFAPTFANLFLGSLITAEVAFAVSRRFWKLEGWRLYSTAAGAGVISVVVSSALLLPKATEGKLEKTNNIKNILETDVKVLAKFETFRPQWFDEIKEKNIIDLLKKLPNLKTLSFLRMSKDDAIIDVEFQDLDGLLDTLFSGNRSLLNEFVPNQSLLKAMSRWEFENLTATQKNCLHSVTGFALPVQCDLETEKALAKLLPHLPSLKWLNLEQATFPATNPLFTDSAIQYLKKIESLILPSRYILNKEHGCEVSQEEKPYFSLHAFVFETVCFSTAVEILKNAPHLRMLLVEGTGCSVHLSALIELLKTRPNLRFIWKGVKAIESNYDLLELAKFNQDFLHLHKNMNQENPMWLKVSPLRGVILSVTIGCFSAEPGVLRQELENMRELVLEKQVEIFCRNEKDSAPETLQMLIDVWSPPSFSFIADRSLVKKKGLEVLQTNGYEIRAQNVWFKEICPLSQTGVEAWEGLKWGELKKDPELLVKSRKNIQGVRFSLVLVAPQSI